MKVSGPLYPWCSRTDWVWAGPLRSVRGALQQLGRGLTSPALSTLALGLLGNATRRPPKKAQLPFKTTVVVARSPSVGHLRADQSALHLALTVRGCSATLPWRYNGLLSRRLLLKTTDCGPVQDSDWDGEDEGEWSSISVVPSN
jgi:hypothetical protein